ncbi:MAG: hypothetical protein UX01_C0018G0003 [Candidatus Collierbacteria bacterium GW2011_GWB2_45_17]|uniref:Uncharacterized protein n=2 Tax=Candidatus Collieribacteriota TaxID=1752725 RepID=A0A0G1KLI2_9BACT|nr:MAG: hypothetical protein UW84_C0056G0006 [Candidatus Collierbacteria bacterium GW2011_GWA2_44_99]KKT98888.1 MAG: hypothetical protein UX01_C0018G0003 [Candidatus Collierbacteria bacterium GW2011_GWB2_45_17]HBC44770.1 hypothetical protein [Candidatus Collierbacteria bacterium]HCX26030.1 hypothetical protein [Candidatus Collierbacteria bacterium]
MKKPFKAELLDRWESGERIKYWFKDGTFLDLEIRPNYDECSGECTKAEITIDGQLVDLLKSVEMGNTLAKTLRYLVVVYAFELGDWEFGPETFSAVLELINKLSQAWKRFRSR